MPKSQDDIAARLRFSITRLARLLRQQDESGLTPTMDATLATINQLAPLTLGALAAHEQVAPPTITKVMDRLEQAGLVERLPDPADRRVCRVALTDDGRRHIEASRSRRTAWLAEQITALPAADRTRLRDAVDVLERLTLAPTPPPEGGALP